MKQFIQNNFAFYSFGCLGLSAVVGYFGLDYIQDAHRKQPSIQLSMADEKKGTRIKSREEMRLEAMVENALKSSWKENLDNAFQAHERFMLPGRDHGQDPAFLLEIDKRADELWKKQEKKRRKRKKTSSLEEEEEEEEEELAGNNIEDKIQFWK